MIWIGYGMVWLGVSAAVGLAVYVTGSALPLWAFLIPAMIGFSSHKD